MLQRAVEAVDGAEEQDEAQPMMERGPTPLE